MGKVIKRLDINSFLLYNDSVINLLIDTMVFEK